MVTLRILVPLLALVLVVAYFLGYIPGTAPNDRRVASQTAVTTAPAPEAAGRKEAPGSTAAPAPVPARPAALHYTFPVVPAGRYSDRDHEYPATDIFVPVGSKFVAPIGGVVDEVSRTDTFVRAVNDPATRGGLSVSIVGVDGVRYYGSHMSSVPPGIVPGLHVKSGDLLAYSGATGSAQGTPPHVHFGISWPTKQRDVWQVRRGAVWPFQYLQAWQNGSNLSPKAEVKTEHTSQGDTPRCAAHC